VLLFASIVWNTVIEEEGNPAEALLFLARRIRRQLGRTPPHLVVMAGALAYRKAERYGADARIVTAVDVCSDGGKLRVSAASTH